MDANFADTVLDIGLSFMADGKQVETSPYGYADCRLLALWDSKAQLVSGPLGPGNVRNSWVEMLAGGTPEGTDRVRDPKEAAGIAVWNADNLMNAAISEFKEIG